MRILTKLPSRALLITAILTLGVVVAAGFEPTHIARGLLRGESFFQGRPTSYWRNVIHNEAESGTLRPEFVAQFSNADAGPVLVECVDDPDRNVRWPAVLLLGKCGFWHGALAGFRKALHDSDVEVRLQAVLAVARIGSDANALAPDLSELLHDPEAQIQHFADIALWHVHADTAIRHGGWQSLTLDQWNFSAMFPGAPEEKLQSAERWGKLVTIHTFTARHGVTVCAVAVSDHPREIVEAISEKERNEAAQSWWIGQTGGRVVRSQPVTQNGQKGHEIVLETDSDGILQSRHFWVGGRLYQVLIASQADFLNRRAADFFLNSFRVGVRLDSTRLNRHACPPASLPVARCRQPSPRLTVA